MKKAHQWKAKTSRMEHLLVGVNGNTKNESKMLSKGLGEQETTSLRILSFLNEGGEVFGYKNVPLLRFYILSAGVARPGELTCHFFFFF